MTRERFPWEGHDMNKNLTAIAGADVTLDRAGDAPQVYADALTALVSDGWADRLPLDVKGKPTGDRAAAIAEIRQAYADAGVTGAAALRQRVLRLTYALHILAASGRREDEQEEAYIKRCARIRTIANGGDREQIDKALTGQAARGRKPSTGKRGPNREGGTGGKGKGGKDTATPKEITPAERYETAHNALVAAVGEYLDALKAHRDAGGKVTKVAAGQVAARVEWITEALAG